MTIELRPYQREAVDAVWGALLERPEALLQTATGGGKTIMFSHLIQRFLERWPRMRIAVLAHRKELVVQAYHKLCHVWPEAAQLAGIACQGLGLAMTDTPIVIGTVQTLARRALRRPFHLMIIDEIHRVAPKRDERPSQYQTLIESCREKYPKMRLLGVTATPYRLGHGFIYGQKGDWFQSLDYQISLDDLIENKYLVPLNYKVVEDISDEERKNIKLDNNGDYKNNQLTDMMCKEYHLESIATTYRLYGENRQHCCIFACSIQHAMAIKKALTNYGYKADAVHSKLPDRDRDLIIKKFENAEINFIINVGILTEGWDSPHIDLIIMSRPTLSPGLYVQMIGRGTRILENKKDLLILDMVGNYLLHGPPNDPIIHNCKEKVVKSYKECPECHSPAPINAPVCKVCGYSWVKPAKDDVVLVDKGVNRLVSVDVSRKKIKSTVLNWDGQWHKSINNNVMFRLLLDCQPGGHVFTYLDFEGNGSPYGQNKARQIWRKIAKGEPPATVNEAIDRLDDINIPNSVELVKDNNFLRVCGW